MTEPLSNALADLAEQTKVQLALSEAAEQQWIAAALAAGELLIRAKAECPHGEWRPFIIRAGLHERRAQRLMVLARSGFNSDIVSHLGGVTGALDWLRRCTIPAADQVLFIDADADRRWDEGRYTDPTLPFGFARLDADGFRVEAYDPAGNELVFTKRPIPADQPWLVPLYITRMFPSGGLSSLLFDIVRRAALSADFFDVPGGVHAQSAQ